MGRGPKEGGRAHDDFSSNAKMRDGLSSWCKACHYAASRSSWAKNRERYNAARRKSPRLGELEDEQRDRDAEADEEARDADRERPARLPPKLRDDGSRGRAYRTPELVDDLGRAARRSRAQSHCLLTLARTAELSAPVPLEPLLRVLARRDGVREWDASNGLPLPPAKRVWELLIGRGVVDAGGRRLRASPSVDALDDAEPVREPDGAVRNAQHEGDNGEDGEDRSANEHREIRNAAHVNDFTAGRGRSSSRLVVCEECGGSYELSARRAQDVRP